MPDDARVRYDALVEELTASSPATAGQMFGMPCMKLGRKAFCGLADEAMVFKLRGDALEAALALPEARRFDRGRPMREWVEVSVAQAARWPDLARSALDVAIAAEG